MPAGSFVGASSAQSATGAPSVAWAPVGSLLSGDEAVMVVVHSNASTVTTPAGWAALANFTATAAFMDFFTKTLTGSETGSQAVSTSTSSKCEAFISVWRNKLKPTSAEVSSPTNSVATVSTTQAVPALAKAGTVHWIAATGLANSTPPTGLTEPAGTTLESVQLTTGGGAKCGGVAHSTASETDGNVGSGSWTRNNAASIDWTTVLVAMVDSTSRIVKTQATTWQVRSRVTKTQSTTWTVLARVAKTLGTTWITRARVLKTQAASWDVAGTLSRIVKTISTTWNTNARVVKTQGTTWNVSLVRIVKTQSTTWVVRARTVKTQSTTWQVRSRLAKVLSTTWNVASMISEATWPAFIGHRGSDPGPEETMFAYDTLYARSPNYWHEGDGQALNDGTTMVANHDDDVDRMYSSGPIATGLVTAISPSNWALEKWRPNTGFTGPDQFALKLLDWVAKYGFNPTAGPAVGLWEVKTGTSAAQMAATFANCKGTVILNCNNLTDAQTARAAGFEACLQTDTPTFSQFTANGIRYLSINFTAMTGTIATNAIAAGVKVLMYTVNSTANRDSMLALFSDTSFAGFISNKPQTIAGTTRVIKTQATTWQVRARVVKTQATTWIARARALKTQATTWVVRARLAKTQATTWIVRKRVVKTQSTTWDVAALPPASVEAYVSIGGIWVKCDVLVSNGTAWGAAEYHTSGAGIWH